MEKIASPEDLQTELRRLMAYCEGPDRPHREKLASELRDLANRVAGGLGPSWDDYYENYMMPSRTEKEPSRKKKEPWIVTRDNGKEIDSFRTFKEADKVRDALWKKYREMGKVIRRRDRKEFMKHPSTGQVMTVDEYTADSGYDY